MAEPSEAQRNPADISVEVLIVGAGFSGLCMGIRLLQAGMKDFLIIEKSEDVGGTWYENRYPGCACDVPSHLYSYSFERNPGWTRMYASQPEIWEYLKSCVQRYGLAPYIRLGTRFCEATWDEAASLWRITAGDNLRIHARVLVSGIGALHVPRYPEIPGLERFGGPAFHSAEWRPDVDLTGKTVAVIGTGASAIQFVPQIVPRAGKLYLFQRTPAWIVPRRDFGISEKWRKRFENVPGLMWAFRKFLFFSLEWRVLSFLGNRRVRKHFEGIARRHLEKSIADPKLRAKLTPNYEIGCKRILVSDDFYPSLEQPNVELVAEKIAEIRPKSIVTSDGAERAADVLIFGTGFQVTEAFLGMRLFGRGGFALHDAWRNGMSAYLGVSVSGFPNFFILLGPNTGLGHNSVVLMIEAQVGYVMECLKLMRRKKIAVMEVRAESQQHFVANIRDRMSQTVWQSGGCRSWYQDSKTGENTALWPGSVINYMHRTRTVADGEYDLKPAERTN
ncbi:MAG TPA: NAD(P)/FAD-dependent oxidoreductase [Candidatus Acidoferrales bacterium]|nr:NAD(P)/FAD-dependent oxidoreductase [Candidatus Acidoferrales bacterium]